MKTLKLLIVMLLIVGLSGSAFAAAEMMANGADMSWPGAKNYQPNWDMPIGDITKYPKGNVARVEYTPELITPLDKQGMPWFQSTLNPNNIRRDDDRSNIFEEFGMVR